MNLTEEKLMRTPLCIAVLALSACASNPDNISAAYVSPLRYSSYDCGQIGTEIGYINQRTNTLYSSLAAKRKADNWQMGVGLVLFWPTLFALEGGDGADAAEYAQLKGEFEALRLVSTEKRCNIAMQSPDEILNAASQSQSQDSSP
ncbi:MAG: metal ABC transporter ATP-binding protein, partial [Pseudohongiella sp.]|nr:metal ABC transporter ATP-binding protein [Pseudohongiella sp.]